MGWTSVDPSPALLPACLGLQEAQGWSRAGPTREGSSGPVQCGSNAHLQGNTGQVSLLRCWRLVVSVGCWVWPTCESSGKHRDCAGGRDLGRLWSVATVAPSLLYAVDKPQCPPGGQERRPQVLKLRSSCRPRRLRRLQGWRPPRPLPERGRGP